MIGSDNVCYVAENEGLSAFDSGINSPKLQAAVCGRNSESSPVEQSSSRVCAVCAYPLTGRQEKCCSGDCQRLYATRSPRPYRDYRGANNPAWKGGASKRPSVYVRRFQAKNPEKVRAQRLVAAAIRAGHLTRPSACASCLRVGRVDAHHPNYALPLSVEWLCRKCHVAADRIRQQHEAATGKGWTKRHAETVTSAPSSVKPLTLASKEVGR
jgi:hypothetical protein